MDYARAIRIILPVGLFLATFVVTLRLSERATEGPAAIPQGAAAEAAMPLEAIEAAQVPQELRLSSEELEDGLWAITTLADEPSAESIGALLHVLASSGDPRERLAAVDALQRIAGTDAWNEAARDALRQAAGDRNAEVAARARSALGED